jgi:hypothetical protein
MEIVKIWLYGRINIKTCVTAKVNIIAFLNLSIEQTS